MPQRITPGNSSIHTSGKQQIHSPKKSVKAKEELASAIAQAAEDADWSRKVMSLPEKIKNWIFHSPPKIPVLKILEPLINNSSSKEKAIAVFNLHTGSHLSLDQYKKGGVSGEIAVNTKTLEAMAESIKLDGVSLAYEYLRKGKELPLGYFDNIFYPQLSSDVYASFKWLQNNNTLKQAQLSYLNNPITREKKIRRLAKSIGLKNEKTFSLELMIELDNKIRKEITKPVEELELLKKNRFYARSQPTTNSVPNLDPPKETQYFIRDRNTEHIKKTVSQKRFFSKLKLKEVANRIKRVILRNKRHQLLFGFAVIVGAFMSVLFPPAAGVTIGMAVGISLAGNFGYIAFWKGGNTVFRKLRILHGLKKIREYADFDYSSVDPKDDHKRKRLIQWLLYVCKHKNFTAIYNEVGDLEKLKEKIEIMTENQKSDKKNLIEIEETKALYEEKHNKLKKDLFFFELLTENVAVHQSILKERRRKDLQELWQERFANMPQKERDHLLKEVSRDKQLLIHGKQIKIDNQGWLSSVVPTWISKKLSTKRNSKTEESPIEDIKISSAYKSLSFISNFSQAFLFKQVKNFFFTNVGNLIRKTGRNAYLIPGSLTLPQITIQGSALFFAFFFLDLCLSHENSKQNKKRMNEIIKSKKRGMTSQILGKRERTEREEIATMRAMAKNEVEPLIDHLLESIKDMEKIGKDLDDAQKRSKALGQGIFGAMSDKDAAIAILKYSAWQHLIGQQVDGAFKQFHDLVHEKISRWDHQLAARLIANGIKAMSISALSQNKTHNYLPGFVRRKTQKMNPPLPADGMLKLRISDVFYQSIKARESGKLIRQLLRREFTNKVAIQDIITQLDITDLRLLQQWIEYARSEASEANNRNYEHILISYQRQIEEAIRLKDIKPGST